MFPPDVNIEYIINKKIFYNHNFIFQSVKNGQVETFCRIASVIKEVGVPPSAKDSKKYPGGVMDRMESIGDVMKNGHKKYASMPHWYL